MLLEKLRIGSIVTTHGLKGEVKVYPSTEKPERFLELETVFLEKKGVQQEYTVESVRFHKGMVILKLEGLDTIEEAMLLRNADLYVRREDAISLEEGEYFIGDLIGCRVLTDEDTELGTVKDILETGANNVIVVAAPGRSDILIPRIPQCVLKLNPEEGYIVVHLLPGLLEL